MVTPSKLTPVSRFVAAFGMLPSSYKEAMTYEEQIVWLCNFLETEVIPAINNNADGLAELQNLFVELKNYVDNYFDNLDIQAEVDAKIEDMLESGQLEEVIAAYLQVKGVLGFNTVADMKAGTNFIDGSIARTLGKTTYNDKEGSFYYIRDLKNTDVIDEINIIAITNYPDLVAEKIKDKSIEDLQTDLTTAENDIDTLETNVNTINTTLSRQANKKIIIIGDSYSKHEYADITKFWYESFAENLGLTLDTNLYVRASDGAGFINDAFYNRLYELRNTISDTEKPNITDIFIVGGLNDRNATEADLLTKMTTFNTYAKATYPNAKISLAYVGNTNPKIRESYENRVGVLASRIAYQNNAAKLLWRSLKNVCYILHNYDATYWEDDGAHPSQLGQNELAINLTHAFLFGETDVIKEVSLTAYATMAASGIATAISNGNFISGISNEYSYLKKADAGAFYFTLDNEQLNCAGNTAYEIGTLTNGYYMGNGSMAGTTVPIIISGTLGGNTSQRATGIANIYMQYGKLYMKPLVYYNNTAVQNSPIQYVYIPSFQITSPSYYA